MTTWISHRGYCEHATENTQAAFDAAIALGFDHLETDLRSTRDGHIVLCHDPELSRISGQQSRISDLTRKELEAIRLSGGEPLLFFDEFLARYAHLKWILDIKPDSAEQTLKQLESWLKDPRADKFLRQQARFLMWKPAHEKRLKQVIDNAFCLAGDKACVRAGVAALAGLPSLAVRPNAVYAIPPKMGGISVLQPALVRRYHKRHARVIGYLPETVAQHEQALRAGVDEILTNHAPLIQTLGTAQPSKVSE